MCGTESHTGGHTPTLISTTKVVDSVVKSLHVNIIPIIQGSLQGAAWIAADDECGYGRPLGPGGPWEEEKITGLLMVMGATGSRLVYAVG